MELPNWRVQTSLPSASYLRTKASKFPALVWPGSAPPVRPATYSPEASTAIPEAWSEPELPNWRVQTSLPAASYLRTKASLPPALVWPGSKPSALPGARSAPGSREKP